MANHADHSEATELRTKSDQLKAAWKDLLALNDAKKTLLVECLREQEVLDELNQINQSIKDKMPLIESTNTESMSGKDDTVLSKHLVKLDLLQDDLVGYEDVLNTKLEKLYENTKIERKLQDTRRQLTEMLSLIDERKRMLKLQQEALEFDQEAAELLQWICEKRGQAQSEDYGQDFEHLALINAKFQALKDEVRSCEEPR